MRLLGELLSLVEAKSAWDDQADKPKPKPKPKFPRVEYDVSHLLDMYAEKWELSFDNQGDLERLAIGLGYQSLEDFFQDNPGAGEAVAEWVRTLNPSEWRASLRAALNLEP